MKKALHFRFQTEDSITMMKIKKITIITSYVHLLLFFMSCVDPASGTSIWDSHLEGEDCSEIWNAEHLDDVLCNNAGRVMRNSLLLSYGPQCRKSAESLWRALLDTELPSTQYFIMIRHDHVTSPVNTWFNYTQHYNLTHKLNIDSCFKIYFFQKGTLLQDYHVYDKEHFSDLVIWIWSFMEISVQIRNIYDSPLVVMFEGFTPNQTDPIAVDENKEVSIEAYMSNIVTFFSQTTQEFLDGYELHSNIDINIEGKSKFKDKEEMWRIKTHFEQREQEESARLFMCSHYKRHFNILTQPKSVPNFTQAGYKLTDIHL